MFKHMVYLDGKFHEEVQQPPGRFVGLEECRCQSPEDKCHVTRVFEYQHHHVAFVFGQPPHVEYHYTSLCAFPILETLQ